MERGLGNWRLWVSGAGMFEQQQQGVVVVCLFKALPTQNHQQKPVEAAWIWKLPNQTVQKLLSASEKLA